MLKKVLILLILLILKIGLNAQKSYFSDSTYIADLEKFLKPSLKAKPEFDTTFVNFAANWQAGKLEEFKFGIVYVSNLLRGAYCKPYPDYYNYLRTINKLVSVGKTDYYTEWEVGLMAVLETKKTDKISQYLKVSADFICDSLLVKLRQFKWKADAKEFAIVSDPDSGLYIDFMSEVNIYMTNGVDKAEITGVKGRCYPLKYRFNAEGGRVTWKQDSLPEDKVFALLPDKYYLNMRSNKFVFKKIKFTNEFFDIYQKKGTLTMKLRTALKDDEAPVFIADEPMEFYFSDNSLWVRGLFKMQGKKVALVPWKNNDVHFRFFRNKKNFVEGKTNYFAIEENKYKAPVAALEIYLGTGKISHYSASFEYRTMLDSSLYRKAWFDGNIYNRPVIIIYTGKQKTYPMPFLDTYHGLEIYTSDIVWPVGDSTVYFLLTPRSSAKNALFYSINTYEYGLYKAIGSRKYGGINHLGMLYNFEKKNKKDSITIFEYKEWIASNSDINFTESAIDEVFRMLEFYGFLNYDSHRKVAYLNTKIDKYIKYNIHSRKPDKGEDFDWIKITSQLKRGNSNTYGTVAKLNLYNKDLKIQKPKAFYMTPSHRGDTLFNGFYYKNVAIYPSYLIIKEDLNMQFGGQVIAGLYHFQAKKFEFNYKNFTIQIVPDENNIMHVSYINSDKVPDSNFVEKVPLEKVIDSVTTEIKGVNGIIYINDPDNKSTMKRLIQYPKVALAPSKIEYSAGYTFDLKDIKKDSLNMVFDKDLDFKGTLKTGILPDQENVRLKVFEINGEPQLGFIKCMPQNGFALNENRKMAKSFLYGCISLSNKGLQATGVLISYNGIYKGSFFLNKGYLQGKVDTFFYNIKDTALINSKFYSKVRDEVHVLRLNEVLKDYEAKIQANGFYSSYLKQKKNKPLLLKTNDVPVSFTMNTSKDKIILDTLKKGSYRFYQNALEEYAPYFKGILDLNPKTLMGKGILTFKKSDNTVIQGDSIFYFTKKNITNQLVNFEISGKEVAKELHCKINIPDSTGIFYTDQPTVLSFDDVNYKCRSDHFVWNIKRGLMKIGAQIEGENENNYVDFKNYKGHKDNPDIRLRGAMLLSGIYPDFTAGFVDYNITEKKLTAHLTKTDTLVVGDAFIYPGPGKNVTVTPKGFEKIDNVLVFLKKIVLDTIAENQFDTSYVTTYIFNAVNNLVIDSKNEYFGNDGIYYYSIKNIPVRFYYIGRQKIDEYSIAKSKTLKESGDTLLLNDYFLFRGEKGSNADLIVIKNNEPYPFFTGEVRRTKEYGYKTKFFSIKNVPVNYANVILPYKVGDKNLYTGIFFNIYNKKQTMRDFFMQEKGNYNTIIYEIAPKDTVVYLKYEDGYYKMAKMNKLNGGDTIDGNIVKLNQKRYNSWGEFSFPVSYRKSEIKLYGQYISLTTIEGNKKFVGTIVIDNIELPDIIVEDFVKFADEDPSGVSLFTKQEKIFDYYGVLLGHKQAKKILQSYLSDYDYETPKQLADKKSIILTDVALYWHEKTQSWETKEGDPIGIAYINGLRVDKYFNGSFKFVRKNVNCDMYLGVNFDNGKKWKIRYTHASGNDGVRFYTNIKDYTSEKKIKSVQWVPNDDKFLDGFYKEKGGE